jgi:cytochrome P450
MKRKRTPKKLPTIHDRYRKALAKPELSAREIEEMREHVRRLARAICEHVWQEKFF